VGIFALRLVGVGAAPLEIYTTVDDRLAGAQRANAQISAEGAELSRTDLGATDGLRGFAERVLRTLHGLVHVWRSNENDLVLEGAAPAARDCPELEFRCHEGTVAPEPAI
jgi:hypothetical protein